MVARAFVLAASIAHAAASFPELPHVRFAISAAKVPACLDISDPKAWYGSLVQVWDCDPANPHRRWFFRNGAIVHRTSGGSEFCLEIPLDDTGKSTSVVNGQRLQLSSCNGKSRQSFKYVAGTLRSRLGGKCVDLRSEDDLAVQIWDCAKGAKNQQWQLTMLPEAKGPTLAVTSAASSKCLDLTANREADGTWLQVYDCDSKTGNLAQRWTFNGKQIIHRTSWGLDLCLDIPSNQRWNGQRLQVWTCVGTPQQEFIYQGGYIKTADGELCLDVQAEDGRTVQLWECDSSAKNQQWTLAIAPEVPPPAAAIYNVGSWSCLDLKEGVEKKGTSVQAWPCDPNSANSAQTWLLRGSEIVHRTSSGKDLCLEVPSGDMSNGKNLRVWSCDGSKKQSFSFQGGVLKTADGSKCVDVKAEDQRTIQLWDCGLAVPNQQWTTVPVAAVVV